MLLALAIGRGWKREDRLSTRLEQLEDFSRTKLIELTKEMTAALLKDAEATHACSTVVSANTRMIEATAVKGEEMRQLLIDHHKLAVDLAAKMERKS